MTYQDLLERIQTLYGRLGPNEDLQTVISAGKLGELERAESLLIDLEVRLAGYEREFDLEHRIATLVASDAEIQDLQRTLILEGVEVVEPRLKAFEDRMVSLRVKAALRTPVELGRFLGDWVTGRLYEPGDVVRSNEALFVCISPTKTQPPSDAWELLVAAPSMQLVGVGGGGGGEVGATGATGPTGPTGPAGSGEGGDIAESYFLGGDE